MESYAFRPASELDAASLQTLIRKPLKHILSASLSFSSPSPAATVVILRTSQS
jgi:hypothetical protein